MDLSNTITDILLGYGLEEVPNIPEELEVVGGDDQYYEDFTEGLHSFVSSVTSPMPKEGGGSEPSAFILGVDFLRDEHSPKKKKGGSKSKKSSRKHPGILELYIIDIEELPKELPKELSEKPSKEAPEKLPEVPEKQPEETPEKLPELLETLPEVSVKQPEEMPVELGGNEEDGILAASIGDTEGPETGETTGDDTEEPETGETTGDASVWTDQPELNNQEIGDYIVDIGSTEVAL